MGNFFTKKNHLWNFFCYDPINFVLNFLFSSPYCCKFAKFQYIQCSSLIDQSYLLNNMYDTRLVGIWTLNLWIQYYKLKVNFHYYGHFHYKCINTLTCEFGEGGGIIWRTKVKKNRMYLPPFSTICINKFFHRMIKVDKYSINEFLAHVQNIGLPFQDGSFLMNQTQFGSI